MGWWTLNKNKVFNHQMSCVQVHTKLRNLRLKKYKLTKCTNSKYIQMSTLFRAIINPCEGQILEIGLLFLGYLKLHITLSSSLNELMDTSLLGLKSAIWKQRMVESNFKVALWCIWKAMNDKVFNDIIPCPGKTRWRRSKSQVSIGSNIEQSLDC